VLLIDDSTDERDMYAAQLEVSGFRTLQAESAVDGFEMAVKYFPDVIVTDIAMPGAEDGFALVRRLKQDGRFERTAVIVLTGHAFDVHRDEAQRAKCDLFLAKPCLPADLEGAIRSFLSQSSKSKTVTVRETRHEETTAGAPLRNS
jgi:CheY-like chemotaxis protein